MATATHVILAGIIRAIGQPEAYHVGANNLRNADAVQDMFYSLLAYLPVEMGQAAKTIYVFLKEIRIDCTNMQPKRTGIVLDSRPVILLIPGNVDGDTRTYACDELNLSRIRQLLVQISGCPRPVKDLEARTRITITPRGGFNIELLHGFYETVKGDTSLLQAIFDF